MRDKFADRAKGYACFLVLIGHVIIGLRPSGIPIPSYMVVSEKFIWTFHIDLFMFLCGYVYSITGGVHSKRSRRQFVLHKLLNLGIPYGIFSIAYIMINALTPAANANSSLSDILNIWHTPIAQYWFLFALFWLFVLYAVLSNWCSNAVSTLILYLIFVIFKFTGVNMGFLDSSFNCVLAFGAGSLLNSLAPVEKLPLWSKLTAVSFHIILTTTLLITGFYTLPFVDDAVTLIGIFASLCFVSILCKNKYAQKALDVLSRYSFPIYLLHTIFTAATRIVLIKAGVTNYFIHLCVGTTVGLFVPIVIAVIAGKSPYLNLVFYPSSAIREIKAYRSNTRSL